MADGCLGRVTNPHGGKHPKNRAKSISQRVTGTKENPGWAKLLRGRGLNVVSRSPFSEPQVRRSE
jgi:hypothetical protein